jgi:hypothetical protein
MSMLYFMPSAHPYLHPHPPQIKVIHINNSSRKLRATKIQKKKIKLIKTERHDI